MGDEGACRYYLSIITGKEQFSVWSDQFERNVRDYVVSQTCPAASKFFGDFHSVGCVVRFLRRACEHVEGTAHLRKASKQDRAVELLLRHPDWSDDQIATAVPTTMKQLDRWTDYKLLRAIPQRRDRRDTR